VACGLLWTHRNKAFHEGSSFDALTLSCTVNKVALDHYRAWKVLNSAPSIEKWIPPDPSYFKINFDTAIRANFSAQAVVCRNSQGKILQTESIISLPCTPNEGEALAAQLAISLAISLKLTLVIFEGDSQIVILALQNPSVAQDWRISPIIQNSIDTIPPHISWSARKVDRSANFCAHYLARRAAAGVSFGSIPNYPPGLSPRSSIQIDNGKDPPLFPLSVC